MRHGQKRKSGQRVDQAAALVKWARRSQGVQRLKAMIELTESEEGIPVRPEELDRDRQLLNCPNGTADLRTGALRSHDRKDLIMALCPVEYDPGAVCPTWDAFLLAILGGDHEMVTFVHRFLGSCLTGEIRDQVWPVFWGAGGNGKSTLINVVLDVLGPDYAMKAPHGLLGELRGERHPTELACLFGKRLVVASETEQGQRLREALVKELTGGEPITARGIRENPRSSPPTFNLVLVTNHKPQVRGQDAGLWRRLRLVPFLTRFWGAGEPGCPADLPPELRQDPTLPEKLRQEYPGILAWMVRGCLEWQREGLPLPAAVGEATTEYRRSEDTLGSWLGECCVVRPEDPSLRGRSTDLYASYKEWTERAGEKPLSHKVWGQAMSERGFQKKSSDGIWYLGVAKKEIDPAANLLPPRA